MQIILLDKTTGSVPEMPGACTIKLCASAFQVVGASNTERLVAGKVYAHTAVRELINVALEKYKHGPHQNETIAYLEIDNDLPDSLIARMSWISTHKELEGYINPTAIEVRRGPFFSGKKETEVLLLGMAAKDVSSFQRIRDLLELARFVAFEVG